MTYVVDAERVLFNGEVMSGTVGAGLLAAALVGVVGLWIGVRAMARDTA